MGALESTLSSSLRRDDEITTVSEQSESVDPIMERLRSLKIASPILESPPAERSLTDILETFTELMGGQRSKDYKYIVGEPCWHYLLGTVNPKVLMELVSIYRDWQEEKAQNISKRQVEVENEIEVADALAVKLLQRFNYSVSAMRTSSNHLSEVHSLQVELGELKGRLSELISNCDTLRKRIAADGPESLKFKPFAVTSADLATTYAITVRKEAQLMQKPS